jgi:hypothetical protein
MTSNQNEDNRGILDWEDLSRADQIRAEQLFHELNDLFRKYEKPGLPESVYEPVDTEAEAS